MCTCCIFWRYNCFSQLILFFVFALSRLSLCFRWLSQSIYYALLIPLGRETKDAQRQPLPHVFATIHSHSSFGNGWTKRRMRLCIKAIGIFMHMWNQHADRHDIQYQAFIGIFRGTFILEFCSITCCPLRLFVYVLSRCRFLFQDITAGRCVT